MLNIVHFACMCMYMHVYIQTCSCSLSTCMLHRDYTHYHSQGAELKDALEKVQGSEEKSTDELK